MTEKIGRVAVVAAIACLLWPLLKCAMPSMAIELVVSIGEVLATVVGSLALCRWLSQVWLARQWWRDSSARHAARNGLSSARLVPHRSRRTRRAGLRSADLVRGWLRSSPRPEVESPRIRARCVHH